jgi:hypothetical protein
MMRPSETARLLGLLADTYEKKIGESLLRAYHAALRDLPYEVAARATERVIATSEFFPRPATIRRAVAELDETAVDAVSAWGDVLAAVRRFGRYREPEALASLEPRTRAAVEAVGYASVCNSTLVAAERKAFVSAYEAMREQAFSNRQLGTTPAALALESKDE